MIPTPTYLAARQVADSLETYFAHQNLDSPVAAEDVLAPTPPARLIEAIIDVTFWASLQREEGYSPKISLAFLAPDRSEAPLIFGQRLPLTPKTLTKLAPAVERPGIHLGICYENDALWVWGTTRSIPVNCFVLEVVEPGLLVVKHRRLEGFGKFINVAILKGDQVKIVDEHTAELPDYPPMLTELLAFAAPASWDDSLNVLIQLAVSMRAHGRGALLLVVPAGSETWQESIIQPMSYPVAPVYATLATLMRQDLSQLNENQWQSELTLAVDHIAGLTAVDGATIINDQYELLGFGAKITRADRRRRVERILVSEPVLGNVPQVVHPNQIGGTRHLSAAQFVYDQRDAIAFVASQDGRFTIFAWSEREGLVRAHQVESLLL